MLKKLVGWIGVLVLVIAGVVLWQGLKRDALPEDVPRAPETASDSVAVPDDDTTSGPPAAPDPGPSATNAVASSTWHSHEGGTSLPVLAPLVRGDGRRLPGMRTGPSPGAPVDLARAYLGAHAPELDLSAAELADADVVDEYVTAHNGVTHIYLRQMINGLEVVNADLSVHVTRDGRVFNVDSSFVPVDRAKGVADSPLVPAERAVTIASGHLALELDGPLKVLDEQAGPSQKTLFAGAGVARDEIPVELVYLAGVAGNLHLAWDIKIDTLDSQHYWSMKVDAVTGAVLVRDDWVVNESYQAYALPVMDPAHGGLTIEVDPYLDSPSPASPFGWHDTDGVAGPEFTITHGNNVHAYEDSGNNNASIGNEPDGGPALSFAFPIDLTQSPVSYRDGSVVNLFYWNNICHDIHHGYGFDEVSGNFQDNTYGNGGAGNDGVHAEAQDGGGFNNANFLTLPDGTPGRMQMFLGNNVVPMRDGSLDNMVVVHEYGHGVSTRLTGGPANAGCLQGNQSSGMGEGWSDWWGLVFTAEPTDTDVQARTVGTWLFGQAPSGPGIRPNPYSTDMTVNPHTYASINSGVSIPHGVGSVWCAALWDMYWNLVNARGFDPDLYAGSGGNNIAMQLVIDGLKLQPCNPTFLDARDGILMADEINYGGVYKELIWTAFAKRGMGLSAGDGGDHNVLAVTEAFDLPDFGLSVVRGIPGEGDIVMSPPTEFIIDFSHPIVAATLDAADLQVNGLSPVSVATNDADTVTFTFATSPVTAEGRQAMLMSSNAVTRLSDGLGLQEWTATFRYDLLALAVVSATPPDGSVVTLPFTTLQLDFNELVDPRSFGVDDLVLSQGTVVSAQVIDADSVSCTLAGIVAEEELTLILPAGAVVDAAGNPCVEYRGSYVPDFGTVEFPVELVAVEPLGSLIYDPPVSAMITPVGDVDTFTLDLDAGQTLAAVVHPEPSLQPRIEIRDPANGVLAFVEAAGPSETAVVQAVPVSVAGTYSVSVSGAPSSSGSYSIEVVLNALVEEETHGGAANSSLATAQDLDASFIVLDGGVERGAVLGELPPLTGVPVITEDFESGALGPAWTTSSSDAGGRIQVTGAEGTAGGNFALLMDRDPSGTYTLNEAVWTVDLGGLSHPLLALSHAQWNDEFDPFTGDFVGSVNADGVAISDNGTDWHPVLNAPVQGPGDWQEYLIDLETEASAAGMTLGAGFQIKFQQYDNFPLTTDGRGYDEIAIAVPDEQNDWYRFSLDAGEAVSLVAQSMGIGSVRVELYDPAGTLLAAGAQAGTVDDAVLDYVAPAAGTYAVEVAGEFAYSLVVTRGATFDLGTSTDAQPIDATGAVLGFAGQGGGEGRLFAAIGDGTSSIAEMDSETGVEVNRFPAPDPLTTPIIGLAMDGNRLFFLKGGGSGILYELDPDTGSVLDADAFTAGSGSYDGLAVLQGLVYVLDDFLDDIFVFDPVTDTVVATLDIDGLNPGTDLSGGLAAWTDPDALLVTESYGTTVLEVDPASGIVTNSFSPATTSAGAYAGAAVFGEELYLGSSSALLIDVFDRSGALIRTMSIPYPVGGLAGSAVGLSNDGYHISVAGGDSLAVRTLTPSDGAMDFVNLLDPVLEVLDPDLQVVAVDDNSGADGRNAEISHVAATGGVYEIRVTGANETEGEYVLLVTGQTGAPDLFQVVDSIPADGEFLPASPAAIVVEFNSAVLLTSLDASDLLVDGTPATGATVVNGNTVRFDLPPVAEGVHMVTLPSNALVNLQGVSLAAYSGSFEVDVTAPRVVAASLQEGDVIPTGPASFTFTFDEPLLSANLNAADVVLTEMTSGGVTPDLFDYDTGSDTLTLGFDALPEGVYHLTLVSGNGAFEDRVGNDLDGEPVAFPIPPNVSGDGIPGGDFEIEFLVDAESTPFLTPLEAKNPMGSMIYDPEVTSVVAPAGDTDEFTLALDAGQALTVLVSPDATLKPDLTILDPSGTPITQVISIVPGDELVVQGVRVNSAGTYRMVVAGVSGSTGAYGMRVYLNAVLEWENHSSQSNDTASAAQSLTGQFTVLPGGGGRVAAIGSSGVPTTSPLLPAEVEPNDDGASGGSAADLPFANDWSGSFAPAGGDDYTASLTGEIGSGSDGDWDFFKILASPGDSLVIDLKGDDSGVGTLNDPYLRLYDSSGNEIAFNDDGGSGLESKITYNTFASQGEYYVVADSFGTSTGTYLLEATHTTMNLLTPTGPGEDWYRVDLTAGEVLGLVLAHGNAGGAMMLELYDPAASLVTAGLPGHNAEAFIQDVVVPTAGPYYARVSGVADYNLLLTRGTAFDWESNDELVSAQDITLAGSAVGFVSDSGTIGGRLFVYSASDNVIQEVDPQVGTILATWPSPVLEAGGPDMGLATAGNNLLIAGSLSSDIIEMDPNTGTTVRTIPNPGFNFSGMAFMDGEIYLLSDSPVGQITVLDYASGAVVRTLTTAPIAVDEALGAGPETLLGQDLGTVYSIDPLTGATTELGSVGAGTREGLGVIGDELYVHTSGEISVFELATLSPRRTLSGFTNLEAIGADGGSSDSDVYFVEASAGDQLVVQTYTPGDGPLEFVNLLDPSIELTDEAGTVLAADDNSAPDGRNALLVHSVTTAGAYFVRVSATNGTGGEYQLVVAGATQGTDADLVVTADDATIVPTIDCPFVTTITVSNRGPITATGVEVTVVVDPQWSVSSVATTKGSCVGTNPVLCVISSLAAGETADLHVEFLASVAGAASNMVEVTGFEPDPIPADNSYAWSAMVHPIGDELLPPVYIVEGTPAISAVSTSQNTVGDAFDLSVAGGPALAPRRCGFGSLGEIYFNYDPTNLYVGGTGLDVAQNQNGMILFLSINTLADNRMSLVGKVGPPAGLGSIANLSFATPMDVAILLGDEYGDGNFPVFVLGDGTSDLGQGVFQLGGARFDLVFGARLSQFDGEGTAPVVTEDDDGNRMTTRWEAAIPWSSLNAPGNILSVYSLRAAGVLVGGASGANRYLSGNYLGHFAGGDPNDSFGNVGFGSLTLSGVPILLPDSDLDGMPDAWEIGHALDPTDDGTVLVDNGPDGDPDGDGVPNRDEWIARTNPRDPASVFRLTDVVTLPGPLGMAISFRTEPGNQYSIEYNDDPLLDPIGWTPFANSANGVGTWLETSALPSSFTVTDDFSPASSGGAPPSPGLRQYRVRTHTP